MELKRKIKSKVLTKNVVKGEMGVNLLARLKIGGLLIISHRGYDIAKDLFLTLTQILRGSADPLLKN